jgi:diguanylate cyclase (GGDEF)-like protein/putative nucleotidyltransferase with HDIG domain
VDGAFCALQARDTGADVFLYRENGVTLARSGAPLPTAGLQRLIASSNTPIELPIGNHRYLAVSRRLDLPGSAGDVLVGAMASTDQWRNAALRGGWLVLAMLSGVLLLSFGAAAALARRVAEPVVEIAHAAHALAGGDLTRRVRVEGNCELRSLAESFNHMAAELERDTERLRAKNDELDQHVGHVQQLNDLLRKVAQTDSLTQVATHGFVQEQLARELELATATSRPLSVLMIDVDHFKWINDTYGHPAGDQALRELAHVIAGVLRHNDTIGRHGGDEFCVILPGAGAQEAERCAERIRGAAARTEIGEQSRSHLSTTVSVGIATYPDDGTDPASLVAAADQAMYQAKLWRNTALSHAATTEPSVRLLPEGLPSFECPAAQAAAGMAASIDSAGKTAAHHSSSVAACAAAIAAALGLPVEARRLIRLACLVHNIGKVGLPRELLDKTGPLTDDERRVLQTHTDLGGRILRHLGVPEPVPEIVRHHHERFDGKGYPCGLEGKNIPLGSRILAVAEAFALATAPRESGPPISTADALNRLRRESGRAFDPEVTAALGRLRLGASPVPPSSATAEPVGEVA